MVSTFPTPVGVILKAEIKIKDKTDIPYTRRGDSTYLKEVNSQISHSLHP